MAINFPANPSNGDVHAGFTYNSTKSVWEANSPSMMATSDTAPTSPSDGQMWFDTDGGGTFVYYEDADSSQWVEVIGSQGSPGADGAAGADGGAGVASVYATVDNLPTSGNSQGDMAHVTANNTLYFWNGSGWYKIALINTNPSISGVSSSYDLAIDGTATVVTVTASDPEGLPITYSIASDTSGNIATVTQGTGASSNVFTVTPSTNTANAGSFTLTFRASDGVNLATAPASFTLQFSVENSNYTTALITSVGGNNADNNDFVDSSTNSHTITAAGNATQTTFSPYRHGGYSTYFDGIAGTKLTTPAQFDFSGAFTAEFWFHIQTGKRIEIGTEKDVTPSDFDYWRLGTNGSGYPFFQCRSDSVTVTTATGSTLVDDGAWHHIAGVRDASGNMTLYVDGVSAATATNNGNLGTSQTINIGAFDYESTGNDAWGTGYLRDVRVSSNVRYSANFSVPTEALTADSDTTLLTCHLPYIADGSTNAHAITVNGNTKTEPFAPYDYRTYTSGTHGGSNFFTTSNDYLTIPYSSTLDFGSNDFTIEWWMNPTTTAGDQVIFVQSNNLGIYGPLWIRYNGGVLKAWATTAGGTFNVFNSTTISGSIPANLWTHVAITRNSSGVWKTYLNGVQSYTSTAAGSLYVNSNDTVIGGSSTANFDFEGSLADFRIVNGTVVYTSDFIPPTAPLTAITNTSLLLNGTNAGIIDKSQTSSVLVLNADTKCSSTQTKYRSTAIYTDGTGDTLQFGEQNPQTVLDWGIGGQPFTVEWWQYDTMPTSTNHTVGPCIGGASATWSGSNGHQWLNIFDSNNFYFQWWGTNNAVNSVNVAASTMNFIQNQWQHIAAVYNGSTYKIYIDGTEQFSTTITNTFKANTGQRFGILGSINGGAYITAAYYDDLRVTKGLARYTANFTPPTAALKG